MKTLNVIQELNEILEDLIEVKRPKIPATWNRKNEQINRLIENIFHLYLQVIEMNKYSILLSEGNLNAPFPSKNNYLVDGLKALHANLLHLTWKVNQISLGVYSHKIDFMGDISKSFNLMVDKLITRERQLRQSRDILELLIAQSDMMVMILDRENDELVYDKSDEKKIDPNLKKELLALLQKQAKQKKDADQLEWDIYSEQSDCWFHVKRLKMTWNEEKKVFFHTLNNISKHKLIEQELKNAIFKDIKTGTYNQLFAIEKLYYFIHEKELFSIVYFDIDNLKETNDKFGHAQGDVLIDLFIQTIFRVIRENDYLCRLYGDEFLLILHDTTTQNALNVVKRINYKIKEMNASKTADFHLNFSYGIANSDSLAQGETVQDLIEQADKKMYAMKSRKKRKPKTD